MKYKILLDTNVLISASIRFSITELQLDIKHQFHDQSYKLFDIFRSRVDLRMGIITSTVENESFDVLVKAVVGEINDEVQDRETLRKILDSLTAVVNICESQMRKIMSFLLKEKCDEAMVLNKLQLVEEMCVYLNQIAKNYEDKDWIEIQAGKRWFPTPFPKKWPGYLKKEGLDIYKKQLLRQRIQLRKFTQKGQSRADKKILAEAVCMNEQYHKRDGNMKICIASCDTGFFSPIRIQGGGESRSVTDEIFSRFGIVCDWPYALAKMLEKELKEK